MSILLHTNKKKTNSKESYIVNLVHGKRKGAVIDKISSRQLTFCNLECYFHT